MVAWSKIAWGAAVAGGAALYCKWLATRTELARIGLPKRSPAGSVCVAVIAAKEDAEKVQGALRKTTQREWRDAARWSPEAGAVQLRGMQVDDPFTLEGNKVTHRVRMPAPLAVQIAEKDNTARWQSLRDVPHPFLAAHGGRLASCEEIEILCRVLDSALQGAVGEYELCPLHDAEAREAVLRDSGRKLNLLGDTASRDGLMQYYGSKVAYYFAFMDHYNSQLVIPAAAGVAVWAYGRRKGFDTHTNPLMPLYSVVTTCWGAWCAARWEQRQHHLAVRWGTTAAVDLDRRRSDFRSVREPPRALTRYFKDSPDEGKGLECVEYFPRSQRALRQVASVALQAVCLGGALGWMVCSLNLQGYMHASREGSQALRIGFLARQAEPGGWLDPNGYLCMIYPIVHSVVTTQLNGWYRTVAERLACWENWRTWDEWELSVTRKRLAFEVCDTFVGQAYLAVVQRDLPAVAGELHSCFQTDCVRRVLTESVIPVLSLWWARRKRGGDIPEEERGEPEVFDDYLEMTMQFLYVTLWSSCFPLAPALALASNLVEVRSDAVKFARAFRRPRPDPECHTEPWTGLLRMATYASVVTNTYALGHASDRIRDLLGTHQALVFVAEHLMLFAVYAVGRTVPVPHPDDELILRHRVQTRMSRAPSDGGR